MKGIIYYMNNEWIFFDEEDDEAYLLTDFPNDSFEILIDNYWISATSINDNEFIVAHTKYVLQDGMHIKICKTLQLAYENYLNELSDPAFEKFTSTLDELEYSIYDCMLCHHFLSFLTEVPSIGVNFFLFDNSDMMCSVNHHFIRSDGIVLDRFEFTRADGVRVEVK